jgi:hypothetical protein
MKNQTRNVNGYRWGWPLAQRPVFRRAEPPVAGGELVAYTGSTFSPPTLRFPVKF